MSNVADLVDRVRSFGANIVLEDGKLRIVNRGRLPVSAMTYIAKHKVEIADHLKTDENVAFEECAAIIEFDGCVPRQWAEQFARYLAKSKPASVSDIDWSWFLTTCGRMIDEAPRVAV
ncbi:hypothetical protein [Mesorhizobium sp. M0870]|uniref:hypothetical protein n=1 Tax=Mesorhizobium sp. M0870 TaxID=2957016 RepID=UPI00333514D9